MMYQQYLDTVAIRALYAKQQLAKFNSRKQLLRKAAVCWLLENAFSSYPNSNHRCACPRSGIHQVTRRSPVHTVVNDKSASGARECYAALAFHEGSSQKACPRNHWAWGGNGNNFEFVDLNKLNYFFLKTQFLTAPKSLDPSILLALQIW